MPSTAHGRRPEPHVRPRGANDGGTSTDGGNSESGNNDGVGHDSGNSGSGSSRHQNNPPLTPARLIHEATDRDLPALRGIEERADALLATLLGQQLLAPAPEGAARAADPGFLLVLTENHCPNPLGFVHVLLPPELPGTAHLEQLSVLPEHRRRGHGRALVEAACVEATRRGATEITLRTFTEVPFNAPFYARCGFAVIPPLEDPFHRALERTEEEMGLFTLGPRVLMRRDLRDTDVAGNNTGAHSTAAARERAAAVVLRDDHVLLMRRIRPGREYWTVPGGGVEAGEDPANAAVREPPEEASLQGRAGRTLHVEAEPRGLTTYVLVADPGGDPVLGGPELERSGPDNRYELRWVRLADVHRLDLTPGAVIAIHAAAS